MRTYTALLVWLFAAQAPVLAQLPAPPAYSVLARTHGSVEAGWYASSDVYRYIADVNVAFDFGSWGDARINFRGGILTLVKSTSGDNFQPDRYRGTLEPAVYWQRGPHVYSFSIRHQSFHTIDRPPPLEESYEIYLLAYQRRGSPNLTFAMGRYANRTDVDYVWDAFAQVDTACVGTCRYGPVYVSVTGHYVNEDERLSSRTSFFDYALEVGVQTRDGVRYFGAFRRIHDIDQFDGTTHRQLLVGIRYLW